MITIAQSPVRRRWVVLQSSASSLFFSAALAAAEPAAVWEQVRTARLDPARAVAVRGLELDLGMATLALDRGTLVPAKPIDGRVAELVFVGEGHFRIDPPDEIERGQLELFTGHTSLDVPVEQVVLTVGGSEVVERLLARDPPETKDPAIEQQATDAFASWIAGAERRGFGADRAVLGAALGDTALRGFFAAWCRSEELGSFYYLLDPSEVEQVTLGKFVPIEADYAEEHRIRRAIRKEQRQGRFSHLRFEDLGDWDTWIATSLRAAGEKLRPGSAGFEPERYVLDVTLVPQDEVVRGTAQIDLRAEESGRRIVTLDLYSELEVRSVKDQEGRPLFWTSEGGQVHVALAEPSRAGDKIALAVEYGGKGIRRLESGVFVLSDTRAWHPHAGTIDRATYDVKLHWPKKYVLLSSGRRTESGEESDTRWERRVLELPAIAFSFEVGEFDVRTLKVGHVDVTIGFSKVSGSVDKGAKEEVLSTVEQSLAFLEQKFGAYPLDELTIATVPRGFSQGFLGFVTLSQSLIGYPSGNYWIVLEEDYHQHRKDSRTETIAHELSHQWWGNKMGWDSYRDQWLSEALADFSAVMFAAERAERPSLYLTRNARGWRGSLDMQTKAGRSLESLGPVVLGTRLSSSLSDRAYTAVVYDKGSIVFRMLSRALGQQPFTEMLHSLADAVGNRVIDTPTFIKAIERMSGLELNSFARQFIYGTGIPEVFYSYEFAPKEGGGWLVRGEARQQASARSRYRLRRTPAGAWFVEQEPVRQIDVGASALVVPFQIALKDPADVEARRQALSRTLVKTEKGMGGTMVLEGEVTPFSFPIDREPKDFWLDQRGEVLAEFTCDQRRPKPALRYRAARLAASGQHDEAEAKYRQALTAPLLSESEAARDNAPSKKEIERLSRLENALIHLGLAELHLERQRDADSRNALETAESMLGGLDRSFQRNRRSVLESHLAVRAGDYKKAYELLSRTLRLDFPVQEGEGLADGARRQRFKSGVRMDGRAYALLAVAAHATDHRVVALRAMEEAEERGADVGELRVVMGG